MGLTQKEFIAKVKEESKGLRKLLGALEDLDTGALSDAINAMENIDYGSLSEVIDTVEESVEDEKEKGELPEFLYPRAEGWTNLWEGSRVRAYYDHLSDSTPEILLQLHRPATGAGNLALLGVRLYPEQARVLATRLLMLAEMAVVKPAGQSNPAQQTG